MIVSHRREFLKLIREIGDIDGWFSIRDPDRLHGTIYYEANLGDFFETWGFIERSGRLIPAKITKQIHKNPNRFLKRVFEDGEFYYRLDKKKHSVEYSLRINAKRTEPWAKAERLILQKELREIKERILNAPQPHIGAARAEKVYYIAHKTDFNTLLSNIKTEKVKLNLIYIAGLKT